MSSRQATGWSVPQRPQRFCLVAVTLFAGILCGAVPGLAEGWRQLGPEGGTIGLLEFAASDHRVVYAATVATSTGVATGSRVFRSNDGGSTWSAASGGLPFVAIECLAIDPTDASVVYAGTADGVWKTSNGGAEWISPRQRLAGLQVTALAIDPQHPPTLYAGVGYSYVTGVPLVLVYRSDDGGQTWVGKSRGLRRVGLEPAYTTVYALAVDPANRDAVVAVLADFGAPSFWKSVNRGASWSERFYQQDLLISMGPSFSGFQNDPSTHALFVAVSGTLFESLDFGATWTLSTLQPFFVVAAPQRLYGLDLSDSVTTPVIEASTDGGVSWQPLTQLPYWTDVLAVDPVFPERVLAGTLRGGLSRTNDGGATWSAAESGMIGTTINAVAADPEGTVYTGTTDSGLFVSHDRGAHWRQLDLHPFSVSNAYPQPIYDVTASTREVWASANGVPESSRDGGTTWQTFPIDCNVAEVLAPEPDGETIFTIAYPVRYECDYGRLLVSQDGGLDWNYPRQDFAQVWTVAIDPADPRVVYGVFSEFGSTPPQVWKSVNGGRTFKSSSSGMGRDTVESVAVSPVHHEQVWAGTAANGVWRSLDQGASWSPATHGLPLGQVVIVVADPDDAASVYAEVQGEGVFMTTDGGVSWKPLSGLPAALLDGTLAISFAAGKRVLYAGTAGAGLFARSFP